MTSTALSLHLDPPKFKVDVEDDNLELWTFRLPVAVPLTALKGLEISTTGEVTKFSANGQDYRLEVGDMEDTESFRVLVPKDNPTEDDDHDDSTSESSNDDDDDDETKKKNDGTIQKLIPLKKAFTKHFSVLVDVPPLTESQVAPREGPPPQDATMRHAYAHVPQRSGLKRRWMPLGASTSMEDKQTTLSVPVTATTKATTPKGVRSHSTKQETISVDKSTGASSKKRMKMEDVPSPDSDDSSEVDEKLSKSERKARKAEKKAAKKAKKEAKKAKKAAKKVKKES